MEKIRKKKKKNLIKGCLGWGMNDRKMFSFSFSLKRVEKVRAKSIHQEFGFLSLDFFKDNQTREKFYNFFPHIFPHCVLSISNFLRTKLSLNAFPDGLFFLYVFH